VIVMTRNSIVSAAVVLTLAILVTGSRESVAQDAPKDLTPAEVVEVRQAVVAWLECEECEEGQLEAVKKLGSNAVPTLGATLERGPSASSRERVRRHLEVSYGKIAEYVKKNPEEKLEVSQEEYVKIYLENYAANYRVRSAQALAAIGGDEARKRLATAAASESSREDVQAAIEAAAKSAR
jgi:HEAT repeat protein